MLLIAALAPAAVVALTFICTVPPGVSKSWPDTVPPIPAQDPMGALAQRRITDAAAAGSPRDALTLLAAGYHPDTVVVMRHAGSDIDALSARIGTAAQFYIEESGHGPVLRSVRKALLGAVDRPLSAQTRQARAPPP